MINIKKENIINEEEEIHDFMEIKKAMNSGLEDCVFKIIREYKCDNELTFKSGTGFFCNIQSKKLKYLSHLII